MLVMIDKGEISGKIAKKLVKDMIEGESPSSLVKKLGIKRIADPDILLPLIKNVIRENKEAVTEYLEGSNPRAFEFLVGQVMKKTRGQADPELTRKLLEEEALP